MPERSAKLPTLDEFMEVTEKYIRGVFQFARPDEDPVMTPQFAFWSKSGGLTIIATPFDAPTDEEAAALKRRAALIARMAMAAEEAVMYTFISEGWAVMYAPEDVEAMRAKYPFPRQDPGRKEVVLVQAEEKGGRKIHKNFEIEREKGKPPRLKEDVAHAGEGSSLAGTFVGLLDGIPDGPPPPQFKEMVAELLRAFSVELERPTVH